MQQVTEAGLIRGVRRWDLVAIVVNGIIGAGIFGLPSEVYALIGAYSLLAFLVCALLTGSLVLCFAEVSSRFSETGGPYLYAEKAFGSVVGFEMGWLVWLNRLLGFAAVCNLLVAYLAFFLPAVESGLWRVFLITSIVATFTVVNVAGVRASAVATDIFTVSKLIPLVLFILTGLYFIDPENYLRRRAQLSILLQSRNALGLRVRRVRGGDVQRRRSPRPPPQHSLCDVDRHWNRGRYLHLD